MKTFHSQSLETLTFESSASHTQGFGLCRSIRVLIDSFHSNHPPSLSQVGNTGTQSLYAHYIPYTLHLIYTHIYIYIYTYICIYISINGCESRMPCLQQAGTAIPRHRLVTESLGLRHALFVGNACTKHLRRRCVTIGRDRRVCNKRWGGHPQQNGLWIHNDMGVCQNYGPFLDPYYDTATNI